MSDTLTREGTLTASEASPNALFGGIGRRATSVRNRPGYERDFATFVDVLAEAMGGSLSARAHLQESMSTSDFPLLFGDAVERSMLQAYMEYPSTIERIVRNAEVPDFRDVKRFATDGADDQLTLVPQGTPYPNAEISEASDSYAVAKYGRVLSHLWEALVNDDLGGLAGVPERLGRAARRSEQRFITELYVGASGPHTDLYKSTPAARVNLVSGNPVLTIDALQDAAALLRNQKDPNGEPIWFGGTILLVVPPALTDTATQIVGARERRISDGANELIIVAGNGLAGTFEVITDPYIPSVATSNGDTSWFLFGDPAMTRPALEFGRLRGHTAPELWVKSPDAMRVGGGMVGPDQGDFASDGIAYRVRSVFGGAQLTGTGGWRSTVASDGSGS